MQPPKRDFTNGDHSFKNFFRIMWKNFYIQLFLIGITTIICILYKRDEFETRDLFLALAVPVLMVIVLLIKVPQFWRDLKSGNSR